MVERLRLSQKFNLGDSKEEFQMKKICIIVPVHRRLNFFDPYVFFDQYFRKYSPSLSKIISDLLPKFL